MRQEYVEILKIIPTVLAAFVGTYMGARLTLRNTVKALEIQNNYKSEETTREREHKDRESLRLWFEDYAITKCIDPLISEILFIEHLVDLNSIESKTKVKQEKTIHQVPFDACARFFTLTGNTNLILMLNFSRLTTSIRFEDFVPSEWTSHLNEILYRLVTIKRLLLVTELKSKGDIYKICANETIIYQADGITKAVYNVFKFPGDNEVENRLDATMRKMADADIGKIIL